MNSADTPQSGRGSSTQTTARSRRPRRIREWQGGPATEDGPGAGASAFRINPFSRFARAHAFSVAGDAMVALSLADSFFFSLDPNDARWRVGLYLLLTVAPFGVVSPLLGPLTDRVKGGHRFMVIGTAVVRAVLAVFMALNVDSLVLFPLAFGMLVMGKTYHVAKSALVPTLVKDEAKLVLTNSRLSIISSISAAVAGIPGVILLLLGGAPATLIFTAGMFLAAAAFATRIPATKVATAPAGEAERSELRSTGIILASSAMGYVRAVVGFLTMLLAFELRGGVDPGPTAVGVELGHQVREQLGLARLDLTSGGLPAWHFGVVLAFTGLGGLVGAMGSPRLRAMISEEKILAAALGLVAVVGALAALSGGLVGASAMAMAVATAGAMGKQSFDAIVQRDAPEANMGRSFARFESRFQLLWVFGAIIPVALPIPARIGFIALAVTAGFAAVTYYLGRNPAPTVAAPVLSDRMKGLTRMPRASRRGVGGRWRTTVQGPDDDDEDPDPDGSDPISPRREEFSPVTDDDPAASWGPAGRDRYGAGPHRTDSGGADAGFGATDRGDTGGGDTAGGGATRSYIDFVGDPPPSGPPSSR